MNHVVGFLRGHLICDMDRHGVEGTDPLATLFVRKEGLTIKYEALEKQSPCEYTAGIYRNKASALPSPLAFTSYVPSLQSHPPGRHPLVFFGCAWRKARQRQA